MTSHMDITQRIHDRSRYACSSLLCTHTHITWHSLLAVIAGASSSYRNVWNHTGVTSHSMRVESRSPRTFARITSHTDITQWSAVPVGRTSRGMCSAWKDP